LFELVKVLGLSMKLFASKVCSNQSTKKKKSRTCPTDSV